MTKCGKHNWSHGQEKEREIDNARFPTDCDVADYLPNIFQDAAATRGRDTAVKEWSSSSRSGVDAQENGGTG